MLSTRGLRYVLSVAVIGMCGGAVAQFVPLHTEGYLRSEAHGVSDNGVVVGNAMPQGDTNYDPWKWTFAGGQQFAPMVGAYFDISGDGSAIVGRESVGGYAIRVRGNEIERLSERGRAYGVSYDGNVVAGFSFNGHHAQASLWSSSGERQFLVELADEFSTEATQVSGDGRTILGFGRKNFDDYSFAIWNVDGTRRFTQHMSGSPSAATSFDGSKTYVTESGSENVPLQIYQEGLGFRDLGVDFYRVEDCSSDGRIVVGAVLHPDGWSQGQIYIEGEGAYELFAWLRMHDIYVTTHLGAYIRSISTSEGTIRVAGLAVGASGNWEAFVATVPEPNTLIAFASLGIVALRRRGRKHEACRSKSSLSGDSNRS